MAKMLYNKINSVGPSFRRAAILKSRHVTITKPYLLNAKLTLTLT